MVERVLETSRKTRSLQDNRKIDALEKWFLYEYPARLLKINRYQYLGLPCEETKYAIELEAYEKENELRALKGLAPLPEIKFKDLF